MIATRVYCYEYFKMMGLNKIIKNAVFYIIILIISTQIVNANDYMSVELQKAMTIECKKAVKDKQYSSKEECTNNLIESLNKVGIVSVTRVNDEEMQNEIEGICVSKKKVGALAYNKCIHEQVYAYLGLEIIELVSSGLLNRLEPRSTIHSLAKRKFISINNI